MGSEIHKKYKTIGVLGGMGAAASADFYKKLVNIAQYQYKAVNDDDFPAMWIYNLPVTGFDETGFVNPEIVRDQMIEIVKRLEKIGSDFIVIPCNTAHFFVHEMQSSINIPILSILESTIQNVKDLGFFKVGLLSSESTKMLKLYEDIFMRDSITTLITTDQEQLLVNRVIGNVISGVQGQWDIETLNTIINRYKSSGAEAIVLGCTELPLAYTQNDCILPLLNTTEILAKTALRYSYGE